MQLAIVVLHFNPTCFEATGVVQPCLVPQMAPFTSIQLSMSDHSLSCSAIDLHHSGPCPTVTVKKGVLGKYLRRGGVLVISWKGREEADSGILLEGLEITQPWASG